MMGSRQDEPCAAVRRYYLVMAAPFAVDVVITAIFSTVIGDLALFVRNLVIAALVLLLGVELAARRLFRPIQDFLDGKIEFAAIERRLTQLPLLSAQVSGLLALPLLLFRIVAPLAFADVAPPWFFPEVPHSTWLDAVLTVIVQTIFTFVFMYFLVSGYLETLCLHLFERHGVNLRLFFGRFPFKIGVALIFSSIAPLILMVGEVVSYEGSRLMTEVTIDFSASIFALGITYFWVSRSLT
ncbi:MAG: hypothetical protein FJX47_16840, partial [Alphaproteobacteria bacterium]|nr:hypothetical protein [Alphaproteobacteria bacterium]